MKVFEKPALTDAGAIDIYAGNSVLFKYKQKMTGKTDADFTKDVEIMAPLKHLINLRN